MTKKKLSEMLFGPPRNALNRDTKSHIALIAFMAWVGLGADGLSSACYGPAEAFLALGEHRSLGIYLAIATSVTVFIIALAYSQVIELFPNGGGGYKVATTLIGPKAGLISGSALIIDYILTVAISVASSADALFSLLPPEYLYLKIYIQIAMVFLLAFLNLRGMKESIKILMPIFLGFVITHVIIISYGVFVHSEGLPTLIPNAMNESNQLGDTMGWLFVTSLFLKAFSLGGGTYTGLEAVSNNVHSLAEPKVKTGKYTMFYIALSLSFMAGGIILSYLLWESTPVEGQTLNAVAFRAITANWIYDGWHFGEGIVFLALIFSGGLLFVAANTGFLAGPVVLANMATDNWMPHQFSSLSSRLVVKNGVILITIAAIIALLVTGGDVSVLVVLYSINVFLTFTLSFIGLCKYWRRNFKKHKESWYKFPIAIVGLIVCGGILIVTTFEKFSTGGWMTVITTSALIFAGWKLHKHYTWIREKLKKDEEEFLARMPEKVIEPPKLDRSKPTAVILVSEGRGSGVKTLEWVQKIFPGIYSNFIFVGVGEVDMHTFNEDEAWHQMRHDTKQYLKRYVNYCHSHGVPSTYYMAYGTDIVDKLTELCQKVTEDFPNSVFFSSKLIFENENFLSQHLHNQTAYIMQRRLHSIDRSMIIMPMKL